ncbi:MAG: hypothetical protein K2I96_02390 [Lachnospiraceae bacterium]|nr:hypothetical protein [Lachnospiraceae bacterium]
MNKYFDTGIPSQTAMGFLSFWIAFFWTALPENLGFGLSFLLESSAFLVIAPVAASVFDIAPDCGKGISETGY